MHPSHKFYTLGEKVQNVASIFDCSRLCSIVTEQDIGHLKRIGEQHMLKVILLK